MSQKRHEEFTLDAARGADENGKRERGRRHRAMQAPLVFVVASTVLGRSLELLLANLRWLHAAASGNDM